MNYISQINGFWKIAEDKQFSSSEIATYFSLLNYCNNLNWLNPFVCHFEYVCQTASISKNTFYACMEKLNNEKLIEYTKGVKNSKKPKVFILNLENKTKNKTGIKLRTEEEQNEEQKGNLYKLLNNETIKPINNKEDSPIGDVYVPSQEYIDKYKMFLDWAKKNSPKILKLKEPLTIEQFYNIRQKYSFKELEDVLLSMENYKKFSSTYSSANLTLQSWLKRSYGEGSNNVTPPPKKQGFEYPKLLTPPVDFTLGY